MTKPDQMEATLESVLRAAPVGIGVVSNRIFVQVTDYFCRMTGFEREQLLGHSTRLLYSGDEEFERIGRESYAQMREHGISTTETQWRRPDGRLVDVLLTLTPSSPFTPAAGVTFTALDITERKQVERELVLRNRQQTSYHRISELMQADEPGAEAFDSIASEISEMTGFPVVVIEMCDFERAVMVFRGVHGMTLEGLPVPFEVPMDVTPSGQVARTGQVLVETDVCSRPEFSTPLFKQLRAQTYVCVPIKANGHTLGALSLLHRERIPDNSPVVEQVESLANYLASLFDRLQARQALRKGEAELAAVYDRAPNVMCLFDEHLRVVRANRAAVEFSGSDEETIKGMPPGSFLNCTSSACGAKCGHAEDCSACDVRQALTETLVTGKNWQRVRVNKSLKRQGRLEDVVLMVSSDRIQVDGMTRVLLCLEDMTHSERTDEQIRSQAALLDITRDAIVVRDFSDNIIYWNQGAHRMYGWTAAEVIGKTMSALLLGLDTPQAIEALRTVREKEDWTGEMQHRTRSGAHLTVQSRWTLVRDRDGAPRSILVVNTDVTEKKLLEARLLRAQRLESIGTLASGLAHDLNNVLTPIMMAVSFLKEDATDETTRVWVQTLETCSQRGADIVRQVLTFARGVEGSRVALQPKHLVQEMQRIARETFPRSIRLQTLIPKQPWLVKADATQVQQVLMNLCVNARDAMPEGGMLTLGLDNTVLNGESELIHPKAKPGDYVIVSVSDTGTGIPADIMHKIFDPFFTTKPLGEGTGLGLPTVLGIAESHGGFVNVESQAGKGTTFRVYLPAVKDEQEGSSGGKLWGNAPKGNGELILVVDDEPAVRKIADVILSKNGYKTLLAADGREAVALFEQHHDKINLLVTDLMMPQMDGLATIRAIRKIRPDIKALTITGMGEEGRRADAIAAGADAIITKPFVSEQLLVEIKRLLS